MVQHFDFLTEQTCAICLLYITSTYILLQRLAMFFPTDYHNLSAEITAAKQTKLKGHDGADFLQMVAFVRAVSVSKTERIIIITHVVQSCLFGTM